jgi:F-type H+-transporting ATPase subunit delta
MIRGIVRTAFHLSLDEMGRLEKHMSGLLGTDVVLTEQLDKALIAGVEVEVGGRVLDNSIRGRLREVRRLLLRRG